MFVLLKKYFILRLFSMPRTPRADANKYQTFASLAYKKHAGNIEAGLNIILRGRENDKRFKNANVQLQQAADKYITLILRMISVKILGDITP